MRLRKDAKIEMLRRVPLFKECTKQQFQSIASVADELDWPQGRPIARQGESGREFVIIVEGSTDVTIDSKKVGSLGAGDFFGEMSLLTHQPRIATVTPMSPLRVLVITERAFSGLLRSDSAIQSKVLAAVAARAAANEAILGQQ
ncbi:MAG: cyclic nucleotide-binding domain-containing protein [Thermoleophilia bacterium]|nr:cyclic nucleotide-binding domain-containing protein [Thermoleophilia bacterium]MDH4339039.1 cyclic nucleotide-binding domain-containing protein [Thermoleophilia bacterium]MDH5279784.1 cyclic nucleotide-binding domain-containing protein [Thermoleophilia bacterium]